MYLNSLANCFIIHSWVRHSNQVVFSEQVQNFRRATKMEIKKQGSMMGGNKNDDSLNKLVKQSTLDEHKFYTESSEQTQITSIANESDSNVILSVIHSLMSLEQQQELVKLRQ